MNQDVFSSLYSPLHINGVQLLPLQAEHEQALVDVCKDGSLWELDYTSIPHYSQINAYIAKALELKSQGLRVPFIVLDQTTGSIVGTTSFRDFVWDVRRVEIGYTWYAKSAQRTHINTSCKLLLLRYAFETLQANSVVLRTDIRNLKSQKAIERLGAHRDGILRQDALRKDGTVRDTVMYSIVKEEWQGIQRYLTDLLMHSS